MITLTINAKNKTELQAALRDLLESTTPEVKAPEATEPEATEPEATEPEVKAPEQEEEKPARRGRSAKKASKKAAAKTPAAKKEAEPKLDYEADVKPKLVELASNKDGGRDAAASIVRSFGVSRGDEIPVERLGEVIDLVEEKIKEIAQAQAQDDSVEF